MSAFHNFMYSVVEHQPVWVWLVFFAVVTGILILDLGILQRGAKEISARQSLVLFTTYASIAGLFGLWLHMRFGAEISAEFFTGYLVELGLSVDNVFVISLIFSYLIIPRNLQHRVLFWGILGAVILRGVMIVLGAEIIGKYDDILVLFGAFLIYSGVKMLISDEALINLSDSRLLTFLRRYMRVTEELYGERFFVRLRDPDNPRRKKLYATPLLLALVLIECGDALFAIDSVPAVFAVSHEAFAVYTSNIFAVLGMRALYFLLEAALNRFQYMQPACAVLLILIGLKVFVNEFFFAVDDVLSLLITFSLLAGGIIASLIKMKQDKKEDKSREKPE